MNENGRKNQLSDIIGGSMANKKQRSRGTSQRRQTRRPGKNGGSRVKNIGNASSQIVKEAAALLDEEIAAGIIAAKKMQQRFEKERRLDPADFKQALHRFQNDAHEVVNVLNDQIAELRSDENAELATRLVNNTHDLLDLIVAVVNMGAEIADEIIQANLPKPDVRQASRRD
jgi:hypothetical protein